jgi:hypothetical protein
LAGDGTVRSITDLFLRLGVRRPNFLESSTATTASDAEPYFPTKTLRKFLSCLAGRESPVLLDLGPVVGPNVNFFGERLGCKIFVEDLFSDLERHVRNNALDDFPAFIGRRFPQADGSVDGILCWDLIDYLDRNAANDLAKELTRMLRSGGALLGFFGMRDDQEESPHYTKYLIADDYNLRHRSYSASRGRQRVLLNRDIIRMFEGLLVSDSFLLQINTREILFRKPVVAGDNRKSI